MSRINTNVQSLIAQHVLGRQNSTVATSLERLSTGLQINSAKDNPAGLIASENLRGEKAGISQAISNADRANSMIGTAEGSLNEVSSLLVELQGLVTQTASDGGLTDAEVAANQQQVDAILSSINRIAGNTQFSGKKLLDGTFDYTTSNVDTADLASVNVSSARVVPGADKDVIVAVKTAAEVAGITFTSGTTDGLGGDVTITIAGNKGSETLTFADGTEIDDIKDAVNLLTDTTGVSASIAASDLTLSSVGYGADQFVSIDVVDGTFTTDKASDTGKDAVVTVNGSDAEVNGLNVSVRSTSMDADFTLTSAFAAAQGTSAFKITGGGADFLLGPKADVAGMASIGIGSVSTSSLGNETVGFLASLASGQSSSLSGGNAQDAQDIVDAAVSQVSNLRARLGSFQKYVVSPTVNSLQVALENASSAESAIRDADFAVETANLTRSQILASAATNVLAMANSAPQAVLKLLQ